MYLINLYGDFKIENAIEVAFDGYNTIALVRRLEDIPLEISRWYTGDVKRLYADGSGGIRVGHEGSGLRLIRNPDGTYTMIKYVPGWQPFYCSGTLAECVEWAKYSPFAQ
ncbi:MAG: hypothetical protein KatS3mg054_0455 [Chloroflexus sp.]|nr:MAG: hypothetical protein KatS3mg054_0429 [Chloroflexus sp.]GIV86426.1 MAG: hypothetical protein KatS3mg054_0455 [Chloroflexus sp.]